MTQKEEITASLNLILNRIFVEPVKVEPWMSAQDFLEWDSMANFTIAVALEEEFNFRCKVGELENLPNIEALTDFIAKTKIGL